MSEQHYRPQTYRSRDSVGYLIRRLYTLLLARFEGALAQAVNLDTEGIRQLVAGQVKTVTLNTRDNSMEVVLKDSAPEGQRKYKTGYVPNTNDSPVTDLEAYNAKVKTPADKVSYDVKPSGSSVFLSLLSVFLPLLLTEHFGWSLTQAGIALSAGAVTWKIGRAHV